MSNNIFIDSTCLFSQRNLLDSISNPKEDVINFIGSAFDYAWLNQQLMEFSVLASVYNPQLAPKSFEDHYTLQSPVAKALLKEKELLLRTIEKLKELGLLKILSYDDLVENTNVTQFHDLKMKVLTAPKDIQKELKLVPPDIDIVAYAIANGASYHSENPKIEDGTLTTIMGVNKYLIGNCPFDRIEHVEIQDIEEFLNDRPGFLEKMKERIHPSYKKIFITSLNVLSSFNPVTSYTMLTTTTIKDAYEITKNWEHDYRISVIETLSKKIPQEPIRSLVDSFSAYRMNPIKHERDL